MTDEIEWISKAIHLNEFRQLCRDPKWGRCYESFSEDTEIVRKMTTVVTGLKGYPPEGHPKGYPIACAKHFVGDDSFGFFLLQGFVISDWEALDRLCKPQSSDYRFCISSVVDAGVDMVMVPFRYEQFVEDLVCLVEHGEISMSRIDDAVERILRVKDLSTPRCLFCLTVGETGDNSVLVISFNGADVISSVTDRFPTLVILISGRPFTLEPQFLEKMDALVAAWLPGSEGEGITDVIFGDYDFERKLPVSWFESGGQLPMTPYILLASG
ncbi:hypothetical protein C1H46_020383 [Malus baccata]|uniref:Glycoside hydrolase family 3 C-terminal domain-containing protein n=1 Tax=Malus baccata TaxID=106549 RepID=A0A540M5H8_MALBA|nr:hypothetical protein C1H46_020383 [Malus baccata]